ncbi:MAG: hypothetical protein H0W40_05895 [Methylibium sp.]|uniref:hypothetical protein n=1 Tax=Methylibium sp. TaxID=2067992 RepID=UPI0017A2F3B0|nr:hypothetical protein [Methylibium sp.]MBA3596895.1 hypothetical protein [Methylibium sp.]
MLKLKTTWRVGTSHSVMSPPFMQRPVKLVFALRLRLAGDRFRAVDLGDQMPT